VLKTKTFEVVIQSAVQNQGLAVSLDWDEVLKWPSGPGLLEIVRIEGACMSWFVTE
jgi:hypothetical protein